MQGCAPLGGFAFPEAGKGLLGLTAGVGSRPTRRRAAALRVEEGTAGNLSPRVGNYWLRAGPGARPSAVFRKCRTRGGGPAGSAFCSQPPLAYCIVLCQLLAPLPLPTRTLKSEIAEYVLPAGVAPVLPTLGSAPRPRDARTSGNPGTAGLPLQGLWLFINNDFCTAGTWGLPQDAAT